MAVSQGIQEQMLKEAYSATPNYDIDPNDPRLTKVDNGYADSLTDLEKTYGGMIGQADQFYNAQIQATQDWGAKQQQIQQEQTDFAIEQINQQKDQAHKDYLKEQSASYVDWRKQSNKYGANAEQMASAGLTGTGFSESSQVSMYNTYQNRVAMARESLSKAMLQYDNSIKEAQLQNNAALAEIAYQTLQQSLELSLAGFQYKNQLILDQANKKIELKNMYHNQYMDVLQQINHENAVKEDIRQYNETMAWNTEQAELDRNFKAQEAELDRKHSAAQAEIQRKFQAAQAELDRKHDKDLLAVKNQYEKERLEQQHKNDMAKLQKQQEYELAQLDKQLSNEKALLAYQKSLSSYGSVSGGSSGISGKKGVTTTAGRVQGYMQTNLANAKAASFTGSTYDQAVAFLKSKGISGAGVLTASEWSRRKSSYSMTGIGNAAVKNYSSYAAYLRDYVNYQVSNK